MTRSGEAWRQWETASRPAHPGRRAFLSALGACALGASLGAPARSHAAGRRQMADVMVLLPGITGSVLQKDGRDVWSLSAQGIAHALLTLGGSIGALKLTADPADMDDLGDGVTATRLFPDVHLIPGLWKIDGYGTLRKWVLDSFEVRPGVNLFEFPYDWRRDNRVAARRLARQSHAWLKAWRARSGNASAKLILVGHSMGGLVSRYFIEVLEGWRDTRALVTFGTPYRGSLKAVDFLCNGMKVSAGPVELADLTTLLRSFTSVYQLLPIYPCVDLGAGSPVRVGEAQAIPGVDAQRAAQALAFHNEIRRAVEGNERDERYTRERYRIHPIVGTYQPTLQSGRLVSGKMVMSTRYPWQGGQLAYDGDGTVPRVSATPLELQGKRAELFIEELHGSLQNTRASLVQLEGLLAPREGEEIFRTIEEGPSIGLALDSDLYASNQPIVIDIECNDPLATLQLVVQEAESGTQAFRTLLPPADDVARRFVLDPLPAGTYRVALGSSAASRTVNDVIVVMDA
jgi:pimeloyl-ACP methyl ester carboxylesterase